LEHLCGNIFFFKKILEESPLNPLLFFYFCFNKRQVPTTRLTANNGECGERNTQPDTAVCWSSGISKDGMGRWQDLRGV
jgi:hypothetical protein